MYPFSCRYFLFLMLYFHCSVLLNYYLVIFTVVKQSLKVLPLVGFVKSQPHYQQQEMMLPSYGMHPLWWQRANNANSFPIKINGLILLAGNFFQKDWDAKIKIQKGTTKPANVIITAGAIDEEMVGIFILSEQDYICCFEADGFLLEDSGLEPMEELYSIFAK